mmetsp:Transcript_81858/g.213081  ORF Transcript_81858/g.213081 Transcript_81858/m.213081 type:complete len:233 (+) Transcript_81858:1640-2338(+)
MIQLLGGAELRQGARLAMHLRGIGHAFGQLRADHGCVVLQGAFLDEALRFLRTNDLHTVWIHAHGPLVLLGHDQKHAIQDVRRGDLFKAKPLVRDIVHHPRHALKETVARTHDVQRRLRCELDDFVLCSPRQQDEEKGDDDARVEAHATHQHDSHEDAHPVHLFVVLGLVVIVDAYRHRHEHVEADNEEGKGGEESQVQAALQTTLALPRAHDGTPCRADGDDAIDGYGQQA